MEIMNGRFGPYISYKKKNYHLPKSMAENLSQLTFEQCKEIIAKQESSPAKKTSRRKSTKA